MVEFSLQLLVFVFVSSVFDRLGEKRDMLFVIEIPLIEGLRQIELILVEFGHLLSQLLHLCGETLHLCPLLLQHLPELQVFVFDLLHLLLGKDWVDVVFAFEVEDFSVASAGSVLSLSHFQQFLGLLEEITVQQKRTEFDLLILCRIRI